MQDVPWRYLDVLVDVKGVVEQHSWGLYRGHEHSLCRRHGGSLNRLYQ